MTSVPTPTFGPTGFVAPLESAILTGVQTDFNIAFGGALNPSPATPQGQLAVSEAAVVGDCYDQFCLLANSIDPAYASGRFQDALGRIYFLERDSAQPTTVNCTCVGAAGVAILAGAIAQATDGNLYTATNGGTIPSGGSITLAFACTVTGPIACPAGSLNTIYQAIPGWDTISNPTDGALGNVVESQADFEFRRQNSVALNAVGSIPAVRANVLAVANVLDAYVTDNSSAAPVTVGGVTLAANSLYVCVSGGDETAVATAIWRKKGTGCGYTGNTTVTVYDTNSALATPPAYAVTFEEATDTAIYITVNIANSPQVPSNATTLIQNAIIAAFTGADGGLRARIGGQIFASRFYAGIANLGAWSQIVSVLVGTTSPGALNDLTLNINQAPTISAGNITVNLV